MAVKGRVRPVGGYLQSCMSKRCTLWRARPWVLPLPPMGFYKPNYESGSAVRWRIGLAGDNRLPFAGIHQNEHMAC